MISGAGVISTWITKNRPVVAETFDFFRLWVPQNVLTLKNYHQEKENQKVKFVILEQPGTFYLPYTYTIRILHLPIFHL